MNLVEYQKLTGKTISDSQQPFVKNQIRRSQRRLETILGYTLDPSKINTNIYNELGKAQTELFWSYPNVDISTLLPPDDVIGAYRLYNFNPSDDYFFIDPFTAVNNVKLVFIRQGDQDGEGITFKTFNSDEIRVQLGRNGIGKYIQRLYDLYLGIENYEVYSGQVQLAVDADWAFQDCLNEDLNYLLTDMIDFYSDSSNNVQRESIEGHEYIRFSRLIPEQESASQALLQKFAGPHGTASMSPTI